MNDTIDSCINSRIRERVILAICMGNNVNMEINKNKRVDQHSYAKTWK